MNEKNTALLSSMSLAALALSGCGSETPVQITPVTPVKTETPVVVTSSVPSAATHTYKDGTYTVLGSYKSPAGPEEIGVTLTLKNDIITDITVTPKATIRRSIELQTAFAANYKPMVIGKNIAEINLGKVAGASLTPIGFNDALAKIEAQAK